MKRPKQLLNHERLVGLFFIFVIGTTAFIGSVFIEALNHPWKSGLQSGSLLIWIVSYETVIISLILHYAAKTKEKVAKIFAKNPRLIYKIIIFVVATTYLALNWIIERSLLVLIRDIVLVALMVFAMPFVYKYFEKKNEGKKQVKKN